MRNFRQITLTILLLLFSVLFLVSDKMGFFANAKTLNKHDLVVQPDVLDTSPSNHPSGKDRNTEPGKSYPQGYSKSNPDGDGVDKPYDASGQKAGSQGRNDFDGNNGCGNDNDFSDDNNGKCLGLLKHHNLIAEAPTPTPSPISSPTPSHTPSVSPTPSATPNSSASPSPTPSATPQPTVTPSPSSSPAGSVLGVSGGLPPTGSLPEKIALVLQIIGLVYIGTGVYLTVKRNNLLQRLNLRFWMIQ